MPSLKADETRREKIVQSLSSLHGVDRVLFNRVSGSITVYYDENKLKPASISFILTNGNLPGNVLVFPLHRIRKRPATPIHREPDNLTSEIMNSLSQIIVKYVLAMALDSTGKILARRLFR